VLRAPYRTGAQLANEVMEQLRVLKLTPSRAALLFKVTPTRISDLARGRLDRLSLDSLVDMADKVGLEARLLMARKRADT
jgi:predicted XRE-type DNA-binding protein